MSRGKYKRKRQHAEQKAQEAAEEALLMKSEKIAEDEEEPTNKAKGKSGKNKNPSRWERFKQHVGSSLFTNQTIAAFTLVLAAAAIYQFVIMGGQLRVMRVDQRAWITVKEVPPYTIAPNVAPAVTVSIENSGKTPAAPVAVNVYIEVIHNWDEPHYEASIMHRQMTVGMLPPTGHAEIPATRLRSDVGDRSEGDPLTQTEYDDLMSGDAWYATHGIVSYVDVFGTQHWTKFCFWHSLKVGGTYSSAGCTAHNSIDHD